MNNTGDIIRTRRLALGLTLEEVGEYVGVKKSTVKKWEDGNIENMRRDKIALLAEVLKVSPLTFIYDRTVLELKLRESDFELSPHEKTVVTAYRKQPEMQPAVDRLLGLSERAPEIRRVARSGTPETDDTLTAEEAEAIAHGRRLKSTDEI